MSSAFQRFPPLIKKRKKLNARVLALKTLMWAVILITIVIALLPFTWALSTSLKTISAVATYPPRWIPRPVTFENYRKVAFETELYKNFLNSLFITVATILLTLILATPAGFGAARYNFPGKNIVLLILLCTIMVPGVVIIIPLYMLANKTRLIDTYLVLVLVYSSWRIPIIIWIMKGFFESVPKSFEESALMDGCSKLQAFYSIVLPLSMPVLAASSVLLFVYVWNEFIIAVTLTSSIRVVTVGLYDFLSSYGIEWGELMSAAFYALIPVLTFFFFFQKSLIHGLTAGGLKG